MSAHILQPAARAFADAASQRPAAHHLGAADARVALERSQAELAVHADVTEEWITVACDHGDVRVRIVRPAAVPHEPLPVVLYLHGGGWVLGDAATHDRLIRELAIGATAAVAFVAYDRSPEAQYPVAVEQAYAAARWIARGGVEGLDASRMAVAGDSAGGNLAAAVAILAHRRGDVTFCQQSLYHPVTDAGQDTDTYREFADGPHPTAATMAWFWDCYLPEVAARGEATASPLRASLDELFSLPTTLVITAENDVLRDEGEGYARRLIEAGVHATCVRFNGTIADFMTINQVRESAAADAAIELAINTLRRAFAQ